MLQRTTSGGIERAGWLTLSLCCAVPGIDLRAATLQAAPPAKSPSRPADSASAWTADGEICVRLVRFESRTSFVVNGARGSASRLEVARLGDSLCVNGKPSVEPGAPDAAAELWIEPHDAELGLTLGENSYAGRLRVRALPRSGAGAAAGLTVDNIVELEDYIAGVIPSEVQLIGAVQAELEAQAIASRSFALAQLAARGARSLEVRLFDTTRDQAYAGRFTPTRDPASQQAARRLAEALQRTRGMVLTEGGVVLDARFHAACGGRTAAAADVFPEAAHFEALRGVDCAACLDGIATRPFAGETTLPARARDLSWRTTLSAEQLDLLARAFEIGAHTVRLEPVRRDKSGRWLEVELHGTESSRRLSFESVRKKLKDGAIGSNLVLVSTPRAGERIESSLMLVGRGRGHGVGLCQNGCHGYALQGWNSEQILAHYYPGSALADGR